MSIEFAESLRVLESDLAAFEFQDSGDLVSRFIALLGQGREAFYRNYFTPGHFTGSGFVLSVDCTKAALVHHRKLGRWLQPGGHADGEVNLAEVARREVHEETGLTDVSLLSRLPIDLDIHLIPAHKDEPEHLHYDLRYLFRSAEDHLRFDPQESLGVEWFTLREIQGGSFDPSLQRLAFAAERAHNVGYFHRANPTLSLRKSRWNPPQG